MINSSKLLNSSPEHKDSHTNKRRMNMILLIINENKLNASIVDCMYSEAVARRLLAGFGNKSIKATGSNESGRSCLCHPFWLACPCKEMDFQWSLTHNSISAIFRTNLRHEFSAALTCWPFNVVFPLAPNHRSRKTHLRRFGGCARCVVSIHFVTVDPKP